jgi:type II secretory pathway component PulF
MAIYRYKAYDSTGKLQIGNLYVSDQEEALAFLTRNNLTPIEVKILPKNFLIDLYIKFFSRINYSSKLYIIRSLYLILKSGLTLDKGLAFLMKEAKGGVKDFLFYLNYNLQRGEPLHQTFSFFPHVFTQVEIETIKAGEVSGNLVNNLERLAESLERQREIRNEIISNLIYPSIVLFLAFGVLVLLVVFVLPKINVLLTQLTTKPPFFTRILIGVSNFVNNNLSLVTSFFLILLVILIILISLKSTRQRIINFLMKAPFFSKLYMALGLSESFFILRSLLAAGLNLTQALKLTAQATFHPFLRQAFYNIENQIRTGKNFGEAVSLQEKIPVFVSSILSVASEAGFLEETLKVLEHFYMEEFRTRVRNFLNLLQPMLLIFVGVLVGFVAVAVLVPIYQQVSQQLQLEGRGQIPGQIR